jgi:hypothetical protein
MGLRYKLWWDHIKLICLYIHDILQDYLI